MNQPTPPFLRRLAERASRGICFRRTLKTAHGNRSLYVTPEASLRYWLPRSLNRDRSLCAFANRHIKPGCKVWDIGANIGILTFLAAASASSSGRVLAIEADPFLSQLLLRTVQRLPSSDAQPQIVTAAVSSSHTLADFAVPNRSRASNHLLASTGCTQTGGIRFSFKVPCVTLDWLLDQSFATDIVKMGIEGMEHVALAAAPRLLQEARPIFHLEVWTEIADALGQLLRTNDYLFFNEETDLAFTTPIANPTWGTVAIPKEKHTAFAQS